MTDTYQKRNQFNELLASFERPANTTLEVLGSIRALRKAWESSDGSTNPETSALDDLAKAESGFIVASAKALQSSELLKSKVGHSWEGVMAVSSLLRQRQAERIANSALDKMLSESKIDETFGKYATDMVNRERFIRTATARFASRNPVP